MVAALSRGCQDQALSRGCQIVHIMYVICDVKLTTYQVRLRILSLNAVFVDNCGTCLCSKIPALDQCDIPD